MYADIHAHILCNIDDGPKTLEQSIELCVAAKENLISKIVATPHFYGIYHDLEERIKIRDERLNELKSHLQSREIQIDILPGFEVRYFPGISRSDDLPKLCLNNSKVLLLELNTDPITEKTVEEIEELSYSGFTVILAHLERYVKGFGFKKIKPLIRSDSVLVQVNASSFLSGTFQKSANMLLKENIIDLVADDMHSVDTRPPLLKQAYEAIELKTDKETSHILMDNAEKMFELIKG